jgi:hypothetical protein
LPILRILTEENNKKQLPPQKHREKQRKKFKRRRNGEPTNNRTANAEVLNQEGLSLNLQGQGTVPLFGYSPEKGDSPFCSTFFGSLFPEVFESS